jgi:hypothetical protein
MTTSIPYTTDANQIHQEVSKLVRDVRSLSRAWLTPFQFSYSVEICEEKVGDGSIKEVDRDAVGVLVLNKSHAGAVRVFGGGEMENVQTDDTNAISLTLLYIKPGQT